MRNTNLTQFEKAFNKLNFRKLDNILIRSNKINEFNASRIYFQKKKIEFDTRNEFNDFLVNHLSCLAKFQLKINLFFKYQVLCQYK